MAFPLLCAVPLDPRSVCRFDTRCWQVGSQGSATWSLCPGMPCWLSHLCPTSSRLGCIRAQDATPRWTPGDIFLPTALTLRFPLVPVTSEHSSANTYLPDVMSHNTVPLPSSRAGLTVFLPGSLSLHLNRVTFRSPSNYCASARTWALCYRLTPARCGEAAAGEPRSVWAAKCLISCLKARQAQASPCYPLLVSPPHSGIPVPPVEITGERFPRFPRYPVCRSRDLQPCVTDSGLVQLHRHREKEALPVAHSQQPPRQSTGIHPGSTEPEESLGAGHRGDNGQVAGL